MRPLKPSELRSLRELTDRELEDKLTATKEEMFNLRFQLVTGHLEDHAKVEQAAAQHRTTIHHPGAAPPSRLKR